MLRRINEDQNGDLIYCWNRNNTSLMVRRINEDDNGGLIYCWTKFQNSGRKENAGPIDNTKRKKKEKFQHDGEANN